MTERAVDVGAIAVRVIVKELLASDVHRGHGAVLRRVLSHTHPRHFVPRAVILVTIEIAGPVPARELVAIVATGSVAVATGSGAVATGSVACTGERLTLRYRLRRGGIQYIFTVGGYVRKKYG